MSAIGPESVTRHSRGTRPLIAPLALALHALPAGNLTFAGGIERSVANLDLTLSLVMADDQAIWRDAGPSQLERMRRRAVGEQLFAAAKPAAGSDALLAAAGGEDVGNVRLLLPAFHQA